MITQERKNMSSGIEELATLKQLLDQGVLTQEEFYAKKAQILAAPPQTQQNATAVAEEGGTAGWAILGFLTPIVGLILFIVWKDSKPKSSSAAGKGALINVILVILFYVIAFAAALTVAMH